MNFSDTATNTIWPSLEAVNRSVPCGSGAQHWWLVDNRALAQMGDKVPKYTPCVCKVCKVRVKLNLEAKDFPK